MLVAIMLALQAQPQNQVFPVPSYFGPVLLILLALGALGWVVAAVLGFMRARVFGSSARWFAIAAVCLVLFHLQLLVLGMGVIGNDTSMVLSIGAFLNLFVVLGAACAIIGFTRLTDPRP
jgi:hypothetical protein